MNEQTAILNVPDSPGKSEMADICLKFTRLAATWRDAVAPLSSMSQMVVHPAYQEIIEMGPVVIPLLLRELEHDPDWWFAALQTLTGENPVRPEQKGKLQAMAAAWLQWGREQGYTW